MLERIKSFLFENKGIRQILIKNTFWITLSEVIGRILRTFLLIYLARILGATDYGKFSFALSFVSMFVSFLDLGLSSVITRELSQDAKREEDFSALITLKLLLGLGTLTVIGLGSFLITPDREIQKIIVILAAFSFVSSFPEIIYAFWRARQQMEYESWANIGSVALMVTSTLIVLIKSPSAINVSYSYFLSALVSFICILAAFHVKFLSARLSFNLTVWKMFLSMSWPLALTSIFGMLYSYTDSVILGYIGQITQNGWYSAAQKIVFVALTPMGIISLTFYPVLSKFVKESNDKLQNAWNYQMGVMICLAAPIVSGGIILAPKIIDFLYGPAYYASAKAFQILIIMAGINFLCNPLSSILIVNNHQTKAFWVTVAGAVVNIALNLILIPKYSLYGAAVATVISYGLVLLMYLILTIKLTEIRPFNYALATVALLVVLSTAVMYIIITRPFIYRSHILAIAPIGIAVYTSTFLLLRYCSKSTWFPFCRKDTTKVEGSG